jgi:EAL domain-containing protein (putative c-di-GMP-specific phosphodiesterase class I)
VQHAPPYPLFVNIHPNEFDEGWLVQPDDPIFRHEHGVYLEITESVPLSHFSLCHSVLTEMRNRGGPRGDGERGGDRPARGEKPAKPADK